MKGPIVIFGATSQIARDFVLNAHRTHSAEFALFARRPDAVADYLKASRLPEWTTGALVDFHRASDRIKEAAGIINFVGVGDPARALAVGGGIFEATVESDALARAFIAERPGTPYVFFSSGAVYGTGFATSVDETSAGTIPLSAQDPQNHYAIAKQRAEAMHRATSGATILDLRIFNYFSRGQDIAARFLITDMLRCVAEGAVFETTDVAMTRDYIHPDDLCALTMALLAAPRGTNQPVDAYSAAPISKAELIALFKREFGLKVAIKPVIATVNATGAKPEYYSRNRAAESFGYRPRYTSAESVLMEGKALLERLRR